MTHHFHSVRLRDTSHSGTLHPLVVSIGVILAESAAIIAAALLSGYGYHMTVYGNPGPTREFVVFGAVFAVAFAGLRLIRGEPTAFWSAEEDWARGLAPEWNQCCVAILALAFFAKASDGYSRGWLLLFYVIGFLALGVLRHRFGTALARAVAEGRVALRQMMVIGRQEDLVAFTLRHRPSESGLRIVACVEIGTDPRQRARQIAAAVEVARELHPDDVHIVLPWSEPDAIEACVEAFEQLPVAIRVAPDRLLERYADLRLDRFGSMVTVHLVRPPLTVFEQLVKRSFDLVASILILFMLAPLFAVVAVLIKRDSKGPVFFRQTRYGFNQEPFRIWKFRSMTTQDDGPVVAQAQRNDPRVTRIGRFLRRTNIDELPQVLNVIAGNMSLVGPRPHAVAHNRLFEQRIASYACRHNVKPGITGWAQVNGHRGETDTEEKMEMRVRHDLFYIDNWSFLLDIKILILTVISSKAYRNAV